MVIGDDVLTPVALLAGVTLSTTVGATHVTETVPLPEHAPTTMAPPTAMPRIDLLHMSSALLQRANSQPDQVVSRPFAHTARSSWHDTSGRTVRRQPKPCGTIADTLEAVLAQIESRSNLPADAAYWRGGTA